MFVFIAYVIMQNKKKPEEKRKSKFGPYLDTLPNNFTKFPFFFMDSELSYLEGSPFLEMIKENK